MVGVEFVFIRWTNPAVDHLKKFSRVLIVVSLRLHKQRVRGTESFCFLIQMDFVAAVNRAVNRLPSWKQRGGAKFLKGSK